MEREGTVTTHPPARNYIIKRPRLTKLLDESGARIILLLAPAGYGKTTLAREWLDQRSGPTAWFSASPNSSDVTSLANGLAAALDAALKPSSARLASHVMHLAAAHQYPEPLARGLANLRDDWPTRLAITIDDYHHIAESEDAETFVRTLVLSIPSIFVITSRSRPSWFEPRMAVYGEAMALDTAALEMTNDEAAKVLMASPRRDASGAISRLAQGWPAVIGLAARARNDEFPESLPAELYQFLADDMIANAPSNVQETVTLLAISGLTEIGAIKTFLGARSLHFMREASKLGLLSFVEPARIGIHPLLAEFLVSRLDTSNTRLLARLTELIDRLHQFRQWDACLAIACASPALDVPFTAILEQAVEGLLEGGRIATLRRWVELARERRTDSGVVDLAQGEIALRDGDWGAAFTFAELAALRLTASDLRSRAQLLAGRAAHLDDRRQLALHWYTRAEEDAVSPRIRGPAIHGQFLVRWEEGDADLSSALDRLEATAGEGTAHNLRLAQGRLLSAVANRDVAAALHASKSAHALLSLPADPLTRLASLNQRAWTLAWAARYEEAIETADRALAEAEEYSIDFVVCHALLAKANALVGLRKFAGATQISNQIEARLREDFDPWVSGNIRLVRTKLQISLGALDRASEEVSFDPPQDQSASLRAEYYAIRALVAACQGTKLDAQRLVSESVGLSTYLEPAAFAAMARAAIAANTGDLTCVAEHVSVALHTGHRDAVVIGCRACPAILKELAEQSGWVQELRDILRASRDVALAKSVGIVIPRETNRTSRLSGRETEVYELLAHGRTNPQIAQALFIAESTVKVHVRHIFEKLGVRSRVEAVRSWSGEDIWNAS